MTEPVDKVRLTQYSHGAGCGCKISPAVLSTILDQVQNQARYDALLVGNSTRDDAAVFAIEGGKVVISTTDFFMPIVDDPIDFGGIAAVNAMSDVYAMGGDPLMAVAILGWPVDKLDPRIAGFVLDGARAACERAGIPLAGGHSIDAPEPIFGLAVTGLGDREKVITNGSKTCPGDLLYLTKPLGVGIMSTAGKKGILTDRDATRIKNLMLQLNDLGPVFAGMKGLHAMTDVTGFALAGHLVEMCEAGGLSASVDFSKVPVLPGIDHYIEQNALPGGIERNYDSYGEKVHGMGEQVREIMCDPQTSGGLLIAVSPGVSDAFERLLKQNNRPCCSFGKLVPYDGYSVTVH